jgi:hypothetical protein
VLKLNPERFAATAGNPGTNLFPIIWNSFRKLTEKNGIFDENEKSPG